MDSKNIYEKNIAGLTLKGFVVYKVFWEIKRILATKDLEGIEILEKNTLNKLLKMK